MEKGEIDINLNEEEESLLDHPPNPTRTKGGLKTMPFIIGKQEHVSIFMYFQD